MILNDRLCITTRSVGTRLKITNGIETLVPTYFLKQL